MKLFHISKAAKKGFSRVFSLRVQRITPLSDKEAWQQNGKALYNDWKVIGDEIRKASGYAAIKK